VHSRGLGNSWAAAGGSAIACNMPVSSLPVVGGAAGAHSIQHIRSFWLLTLSNDLLGTTGLHSPHAALNVLYEVNQVIQAIMPYNHSHGGHHGVVQGQLSAATE